MPENEFKRFIEMLQSFDRAMLVSQRDGQLRSRPMQIGDVAEDGRIRFITRDDSGKLDELTEHPQVNISAQDDSRYISVSGDARLTKDPEIVEQAWRATQAPWFAEGKRDAHVIALEVMPVFAEYWDRSDVGLVTWMLDGARAMLTANGRLDDESRGEHGNVDFSDRPL